MSRAQTSAPALMPPASARPSPRDAWRHPFWSRPRERESLGRGVTKERAMTKERSFKRRVRERMSKTGESYTAARGHVSQKRDRVQAARTRLAAATDRPSDGRIEEATGRTWDACSWSSRRPGAKASTSTRLRRPLPSRSPIRGRPLRPWPTSRMKPTCSRSGAGDGPRALEASAKGSVTEPALPSSSCAI